MISRSHPLARRLRALRKDRDLRDREGVLVAEGLHLVAEALSSGLVIEAAVFAARLNRDPEGRALAGRERIEVKSLSTSTPVSPMTLSKPPVASHDRSPMLVPVSSAPSEAIVETTCAPE